MPHIENDFYDVPDPEDIDQEELLPKTPKRPRQPPLADRQAAEKTGGGLIDKYSISGWIPPEIKTHESDTINNTNNWEN